MMKTKPQKTACPVLLVNQRGAAAVEFALVLVLLLAVVAGIVEFGRTFWYYDALTKATRDGARFLSISKSLTSSAALDVELINQAKAMVVNAATEAKVPDFSAGDVAVSCEPDCVKPSYVTLSINAYPIVIGEWVPFFVSSTTTAWNAQLSPYTTLRYMR